MWKHTDALAECDTGRNNSTPFLEPAHYTIKYKYKIQIQNTNTSAKYKYKYKTQTLLQSVTRGGTIQHHFWSQPTTMPLLRHSTILHQLILMLPLLWKPCVCTVQRHLYFKCDTQGGRKEGGKPEQSGFRRQFTILSSSSNQNLVRLPYTSYICPETQHGAEPTQY